MSSDVLPDPATPFGRRVRERLRDEWLIWLTTVGKDGTPQPNPVWFLWDGADQILTYNLPDAYRMGHMAARPQVSLHFNSNQDGGDIVVLRGVAERVHDEAPPHESGPYLDKYRSGMIHVSGSIEAFGTTYSAPVRIRITRVRGF
ncbi:TIGR03667 family PPOX class F420-dependent oxidoreductase [Actinobacteria bacterium YIM 96077]|uniref:TIGR03667 family PPOX class F420-dependent oxidoreductase n=1 Tax=Phytoactinopolyspora halophila TaxID=1981511 RepID=A0A329QAL9_9ACTN|nr:TIGR03667 family PPOX class F420-dependent oxidoreductase [Phytoactinopolyspora halophila]AYY12500.1 TIGR03667 family PPOX class F420-dependent oxidoreductase [Actinobacteria bacterium YIM 96077]RAW09440.1 TIGR03667 family PPOX class F420-dependent oxidoreductase [Phytoactinopolyspora halophila]